MFPSRRGANALNELARLSRRQMVPNKDRTEPGTGPHEMHYKDSYHLVPQIRAVVVIFFNYRDMSVRIHHPITRLSFPFSALPLWLHLGGSSTPPFLLVALFLRLVHRCGLTLGTAMHGI